MVKANADNILVKVGKPETVTASGIIIPDSNSEERKYEGKVINVGNDPSIKANDINVGDYVMYQKGCNHEITIDGELYDLVSVFDVIAKVEE